MAGGLFNKPFALNVKCIIFALICMVLFLYKPNFTNNYTLYTSLFLIFIISYVGMAWYDYFYDCRILPLRKGWLSWQNLIKPPAHQPEKQKDWSCEDDTDGRLYIIYLSHIIFIAPLIAYIAIYKTKVNKIVYPILGVLAIFTILYHSSFLIRGVALPSNP